MDNETLKSKVDFTRKGTLVDENGLNQDYLMDEKGNYIIPLSVLEFKLIEKIKDLEERIKILEERK